MNYGRGMMLARTRAGMSKRQLAKEVGVDASFITHIETGRRKPSLDTLEKAAEVLGIPMPVLMLLSAEPGELRGITSEQAAVFGDRLAGLLKVVS